MLHNIQPKIQNKLKPQYFQTRKTCRAWGVRPVTTFEGKVKWDGGGGGGGGAFYTFWGGRDRGGVKHATFQGKDTFGKSGMIPLLINLSLEDGYLGY